MNICRRGGIFKAAHEIAQQREKRIINTDKSELQLNNAHIWNQLGKTYSIA